MGGGGEGSGGTGGSGGSGGGRLRRPRQREPGSGRKEKEGVELKFFFQQQRRADFPQMSPSTRRVGNEGQLKR